MMRRILSCLAIFIIALALGCGQKGPKLSSGSKQAVAEYEMGVAATEKLYFEDAARHFQTAVEHDPKFAEAWSRLSRTMWELGDEAGAMQNQKKALGLMQNEKGKDRVTERERLIIVLHDAYLHNDFSQAQEILNRMVEEFPKDREVHVFAAMEQQRLENYDQAISAYDRVVELDPDYAQAYNSLGYLYLAKGDLDRAKENLEKYRKMVSDEANPYDSIGELEQARGDYQEALKYYQKALDMNPDLRFVLHHLGELYRIQGQYARAIEFLLAAAEKAVGAEAESDSRQYLAYAYMRRGDLRQALTEAKRAVELNPKDPHAYFDLGLVHVAMNDLSAAMEDAQKINEWVDKQNLRQYRVDRLFYYLTGQIHLARREYEIAIDSHRRAVDLTPNVLFRNFYLHALGNAYLEAGRLEEAIATLQMALRQNPHDPDCLLTMVLVYKELGDKKLAKQYVKRFQEVVEEADEGVEWIERVEKLRL
jgi:tetratricopeptide (TPR) repeat protein